MVTRLASVLDMIVGQGKNVINLFEQIPGSLIALVGRFSLAAVFWKSGQTKVEGLAIDIIDGTYDFGWPRLSDSAIVLFKEEYRVPLISPDIAAHMAAFSEHLFPVLLLLDRKSVV